MILLNISNNIRNNYAFALSPLQKEKIEKKIKKSNIVRHINKKYQMILKSNLRLKIKRELFKRFRYKNLPKQEVSYISVQKNIFSKSKRLQVL